MKSRIPLSGKGAKNTAKTRPLSPFRDGKKKFTDPTGRGRSNDIAHRSIIQVFTVLNITSRAETPSTLPYHRSSNNNWTKCPVLGVASPVKVWSSFSFFTDSFHFGHPTTVQYLKYSYHTSTLAHNPPIQFPSSKRKPRHPRHRTSSFSPQGFELFVPHVSLRGGKPFAVFFPPFPELGVSDC